MYPILFVYKSIAPSTPAFFKHAAHSSKRFASQQPSPRRLKATFNCLAAYRQEFAHSTAQLTISVGQRVHEADYLLSALRLVASAFKRCIVVIDDSIQSYTAAIGAPHKTKAQLLDEAIQAGDAYLERNRSLFETYLTIPYEIVRWRDWLHTPQWYTARATMHRHYEEHNLFRQAIDQCVLTFLQRYEKNHSLIDYDRSRAVALCKAYLLEECAVMKELWVPLGCEFEVYPGGRNEAMHATHTFFIAPYHPRLLEAIALRFNRRNAPGISIEPTINKEKLDETQAQESALTLI